MIKSSNKIQIALDNNNNVVYNTSMTNNNTNGVTNTMTNTMTHNFRVYMHANGSFDAFANFTSVKEALGYMRNWSDNMHNWFIYDENTGRRFKMDDTGERLMVVYSAMNIPLTK
jgi:hypothetical protein